MNGTTHTLGETVNHGCADLLGLGMDYEYVSPERRALMHGTEKSPNVAVPISLIDDEPMEVEMHDMQVEPTLACQEHSNDANRFHDEQARSTLDFSNTAQRPIRAHRNRSNNFRLSNRYSQHHHYTSRQSVYRDLDDARGRVYHYSRQTCEPSPDALRNRGEAIFVSAMADADVKEERDDRRDGDRYRGGGHNKRRRDGELATEHPSACATLT